MKKIYWKVHKDDIKFIKESTPLQMKCWSNICDEYNGYIYISKDDIIPTIETNRYRYMCYLPSSDLFFQNNGYEYMGEFNLTRIRRDKLKKLSKNE